jgi:hypothetical protein
LFDTGNNHQVKGGDILTVTLTGSLTASVISQIEIFDLNNGKYKVTYTIQDASQTFLLNVVTNGVSASPQTSTITVVPNVPSPITSTLTATTPVTVGVAMTYSLQIFDAYMNTI